MKKTVFFGPKFNDDLFCDLKFKTRLYKFKAGYKNDIDK